MNENNSQIDAYTIAEEKTSAPIGPGWCQWHLAPATLMQDQISWTLATCGRILRPVVRLALSLGLKHPQLESLLRDLLIDEARRLWRANGVEKPNISQLAVTTGLNRKEVTVRVRTVDAHMPVPHMSPAAQVFTAWLRLATESPQLRRLAVRTEGNGVSFESLARDATRGNVHHRAVLDDLIRLGMVVELDGHVDLAADGFVPARDLQSMLAFVGDNTGDHLLAAVRNILNTGPRLLERAVYADGLTPDECERLHQLARSRWDTLHTELVREMTQSVDASGDSGKQRMRVGIYVLYEDAETQAIPGRPKTPP